MGGQALRGAYDGRTDPRDFIRSFYRTYTAALEGRLLTPEELFDVRTLTEPQFVAAVEAAQEDLQMGYDGGGESRSVKETWGEGATEEKADIPNIKYPGDDPAISPGDGWEWRGPDQPGGIKGAWYNPETGETFKPDLGHGDPVGSHWDYIPYKNGPQYRVYPDGTIIPKGGR